MPPDVLRSDILDAAEHAPVRGVAARGQVPDPAAAICAMAATSS
jgi:hypothetical protein